MDWSVIQGVLLLVNSENIYKFRPYRDLAPEKKNIHNKNITEQIQSSPIRDYWNVKGRSTQTTTSFSWIVTIAGW
jgi:hypothetical protein